MSSLRVTLLDGIIVGGYFLVMLGVGLWFGRKKIRSSDGLFLADREANWVRVGASMFSANISSQQFVGQAGLTYSLGLAAGGFQLVGALCFGLLALFFVDVYLGLRLKTAPEFFERRYSAGVRILVSLINLVMILAATVSTALYAGATVMTELIGWDQTWQFGLAVWVIGSAAGLYTVLGGLRSVLWVDLLQVGLLLVGGTVTFLVSLHAAGGWSEVLPTYDEEGRSMWSVVQPRMHPFGWLPLLTGAIVLGVHSHCTDHDYVQRVLAARSLYHSKMGALFAAFLKLIALFVIAAPGVIAAKLLPGLVHPDQAYARLVSTYVPPGLAGLVLAGLLAAVLGTVAAGLSASASLITFDFVQRLAPRWNELKRVRVGRGVMITVLLVCGSLAPRIRHFESVFLYLVQLSSLLAPPVFVCVVAGVFTKRASARAAMVTLVGGFILSGIIFGVLTQETWMAQLPRYFSNPLNCCFVLTLLCAGLMTASGWIFPETRSADSLLEEQQSLLRKQRMALTGREARVYRFTTVVLTGLGIALVWLFSPWGVASPRM